MTHRTSKPKIISRKVEFDGWRRLETIIVQPQSMKHDDLLEPMSREVLFCGEAVIVLLYLLNTDQILLNEQFRAGAFMAGAENPWLMECCAGMIDKGETPENAARREAKEETGCDILDLEFIGNYYPSAGATNEKHLIYCGLIDNAKAGHYGLEEDGEDIKTHLIAADEAIKMLDAGQFTNASTVLCLHWFARNRDRLRQKWSNK